MQYPRLIRSQLEAACQDTPVVLVNGARQTGKTTLVRDVLGDRVPYVTFDDATTRATATADPNGFIRNLPENVILDEVQLCPEIFPAIKISVDNNRRPGRFILTGSANVLLLPKLSESLAGRMEILTLWPMAQNELETNAAAGIVDALFESPLELQTLPDTPREELVGRIIRGGYPEPLQRSRDDRRQAWFASYVTTILQRDIRDISGIEGLGILPALLGVLAGRAGNLLNVSELASLLGAPYATVHRYVALLEATFLTGRLPAWSGNLGMRFAKTPKCLVSDSGLACHLLGLDSQRLCDNGTVLGMQLENFVAMELTKQATWSRLKPNLFHWRDQKRNEVDIVLETRSGDIVAVEVKASATVANHDFKGIRSLQSQAPDRFKRGVVLYSGSQIIPFDDQITALPIAGLWHGINQATA